jgi:hypothetical protein
MWTQAEESTAVKAYAEVWGTDESGYEYAPVAWMEAMVDPYKNSAGEDVITLMLHEDWVHNVRQPPLRWIERKSARLAKSTN